LEYKPNFLEPEYPFEWAGAFDLAAGRYSLVLQQGPDPTMDLAFCPVDASDGSDPAKAAERAFGWFSAASLHLRATGATISPAPEALTLDLPASGEARFVLNVDKPGAYWLFTQHLPSEFALQLLREDGSAVSASVEKDFAPGHSHDELVGSISLQTTVPLDPQRFQKWITGVQERQGTRLYRLKGFVSLKGVDERIVIQGVHMVLDTSSLGPWGDRPRRTQLVFIGRELDEAALESGFKGCFFA
jgi:hypothetical protein